MRILTAQEGKTFAFKNEKDEEVILGSVLYLGKNDDGSRYYEVRSEERRVGKECYS